MNDQSKTKQAIIQESNSLEYAESIINTVREPLIVLDHDLRVVTASRSFYEFFKVNSKETEGQLIYDLGNRQWNIPKLRELLEDILPQKTTFDNYEVEHDFTTIGKRIMLLNARQINRVLGKEHIILLAIEDITERKQLENLLTDSEELYRRLFETASDVIMLLEKREGKIIKTNPATEKLLGYTEKESIGNKLQDVGVVLDMIDFQTTIQNLNKNGIINYRNVKVETKSGENIDTEIYLVDRTKLIQCNIRDITERKLVESQKETALDALRKSEDNFHRSLDESPLGVRIVTAEGETLYANRAIVDIYGYDSIEELGGAPLTKLYTPESYAEFKIRKEKRERGEFGPSEYEISIVRKNGEVRQVHVFRREIFWNGARQFQVIYQDITDRKRAEKDLKESEKQYRLLADNVHDVIFVMDMNLNYTYVSPSVKLLRGYEPEETLKQTIAEILTPSSMDLAMRTLSEIMEMEKSESRDINVSRTLELEMSRKDGTTVWTEVKTSFIRDENRRVIGIMGVIRDITERKKAEREIRLLNEELEQRVLQRTAQLNEVNKELEKFSYSVSHDLRAPLRSIDRWSLALLEDYGDRLDDQARTYLGRVRTEAQMMEMLINDLLNLSRITRIEPQLMPLDLTAMAHSLATHLQEEKPDRRIEFIIQPDLRADGDNNLINIALTNLFDNAVKFTGKRSLARIEFGEAEVDGGKAFFVRDNGAGFDMANADKLFGTFQRLHKASEFPGTGIGLATVQRIIQRHGGRIWANAKVDQGATFYFTLKETI
jgi:PAS domain S-box-containing protein